MNDLSIFPERSQSLYFNLASDLSFSFILLRFRDRVIVRTLPPHPASNDLHMFYNLIYFLTQICFYAHIQYEELGVNMNKTEKIPVFTEHLVGKMDYKQTKI